MNSTNSTPSLDDLLAKATTIIPPDVKGLWSDYVEAVKQYDSFKDLQAQLLKWRDKELAQVLDRLEKQALDYQVGEKLRTSYDLAIPLEAILNERKRLEND